MYGVGSVTFSFSACSHALLFFPPGLFGWCGGGGGLNPEHGSQVSGFHHEILNLYLQFHAIKCLHHTQGIMTLSVDGLAS